MLGMRMSTKTARSPYAESHAYLYPAVKDASLKQERTQKPQLTGGGNKEGVLFEYE